MGSSHVLHGVTIGAVGACLASLAGAPDHVAVVMIPAVAYSALLPDLDHRRSAATLSLGPVTMLLSFVLRLCVEHRGATHRPEAGPVFGALAVLALAVPAGWWALLWGAAVCAGVWTHIYGDARTLSGTPLRRGRRMRVGRVMRTGSPRERWLQAWLYRPVAVASSAGAVALLVYM